MPRVKMVCAAAASLPLSTMFCPACADRSNRTTSPSRLVCSIITTASAPAGTAAPVMICKQVPAASASLTVSPALISPTHFSCTPGAASFERTAYPSRVERSNGGYSRSVFTSRASTHPSASHTLTRTVPRGPFFFPTCSITFRRASSKVSIPARVWHLKPSGHKSRVASSQPARQQRPCRDNRRTPLRPRGDHSDLHLQKIGNEPQIIHGRFREFGSVLYTVCRFIPARQLLVLWRDVLVFFRERRHFFQRRAFIFVPHANLDLPLRIEYIQLRNHQRIDPIDHLRVAQHFQIQPAASPRPSRYGSELLPALPYFLRVQLRHLRGKWPAADARCVGLRNSQHVLDFRRRHAHARGGPARGRARRRHKR